MFIVYRHTAPNGKIYIGITSRKPEKRWENGKGYKDCSYFYKAIKKYGWDNIRHEILAENLTKEQAEEMEIELIRKYNSTDPSNGYNLRKGGSVCGFSEQAIKKMSESHVGIRHTVEQKEKIRNKLKGRKTSKGTLGYKHTEETKRKMSKSALEYHSKHESKIKGGKNPHASKIRNIDTGETFDCLMSACQKYGVSHSSLSNACRGKTKTCSGFRWEYIEEAQ